MKIAFQCCVGFCHTTVHISRIYTYIPSLLSLSPIPHPASLGLCREEMQTYSVNLHPTCSQIDSEFTLLN